MFPDSPGMIRKMTPDKLPDPQLDPQAFEQLIKNRGLRWKHEKASPCPNITDLETNSHDPNCRECENGMRFYGSLEVHGFFQGNKLERIYEIQGSWDVGEAVVTFSAYADDEQGNPGRGVAVDLQHYDKLTCLDYSFRFQELIEHSPTGVDRFRYPALTVEFLATKSKVYVLDQDFAIDEVGYIRWLNQNQPGYNQLIQRGEIFTVAYCARPVFYVIQLIHEIRATKALDPITGQIIAVRLPQQVLIRRDYLFSHSGDKTGQSDAEAPRGSGNTVPG